MQLRRPAIETYTKLSKTTAAAGAAPNNGSEYQSFQSALQNDKWGSQPAISHSVLTAEEEHWM